MHVAVALPGHRLLPALVPGHRLARLASLQQRDRNLWNGALRLESREFTEGWVHAVEKLLIKGIETSISNRHVSWEKLKHTEQRKSLPMSAFSST